MAVEHAGGLVVLDHKTFPARLDDRASGAYARRAGIVPPSINRRRLAEHGPVLRLRGKLRCVLSGGTGDVMTRTLPSGDPFRVPPGGGRA